MEAFDMNPVEFIANAVNNVPFDRNVAGSNLINGYWKPRKRSVVCEALG